jgi:hypothetical protein
MTLETFLRKFKKLAPEATWVMDHEGYLRTVWNGCRHCPITFVVQRTTGERYLTICADRAAESQLGMKYKEALQVVAAADGSQGFIRGKVGASIRRRLLKACGLTELALTA